MYTFTSQEDAVDFNRMEILLSLAIVQSELVFFGTAEVLCLTSILPGAHMLPIFDICLF